jgi:hypothetical protein
MDIQHTPIRNISSSFVLAALRLLYDLLFPKRQSGFVKAFAANGSIIRARKVAGIIRVAACHSRRRNAFNKAVRRLGPLWARALKLLKGAHIAPIRDDFLPT